MSLKICGSRRFRGYSDKNRERFYLENTQNRVMFEVKAEDWEEFYGIVQTMDRNIKRKSKEVS